MCKEEYTPDFNNWNSTYQMSSSCTTSGTIANCKYHTAVTSGTVQCYECNKDYFVNSIDSKSCMTNGNKNYLKNCRVGYATLATDTNSEYCRECMPSYYFDYNYCRLKSMLTTMSLVTLALLHAFL